ncbi:MAG: hypothetical protein HQ506_03270 [Candidatus Marinimicrobia bacterium]|nr:hypothetical protein [Candidatus Neomarinimicrobiota bacterium]
MNIINQSCFDGTQQDTLSQKKIMPVSLRLSKGLIIPLLFLIVFNGVFASGLGGYTGTSNRFTSDPRSAGTGGITLFHETSTNSYSQNPASQAFFGGRSFDAGLVQLSLDRFIYSINTGIPLPPTASLSFGLIAAGTKNIEARDSRGYAAGDLSDTEMTYLVSFSNRFSDKLAFGLSLKVLTKRFKSEDDDWLDLKGTGFGAGLGFVFKPRTGSTFALAIKDWNSSYKWKTQDLFERGSSYQDQFPISLSWGWLQDLGSFSLAWEHDYYFIDENIYRVALMWHGIKALDVNVGASFEDDAIYPGISARYELSWKEGPPMHIDWGMKLGTPGEGYRNYIGWGVNF